MVGAFNQLEYQSQVDGLTGIHNRRFFDTNLKREFMRSRRNKSPLSIIICDLDFFKAYNDIFGHVAGDKCLQLTAETMTGLLKRPGDIVARIGGEEFGIILPDTSREGAITIAELTRAKIEDAKIPHTGNKVSKFVTISIGVCTYNGEEMNMEDLYKLADKALYSAKQAGRNTINYFSESKI